jgi:predicted CopG family antitoxin
MKTITTNESKQIEVNDELYSDLVKSAKKGFSDFALVGANNNSYIIPFQQFR